MTNLFFTDPTTLERLKRGPMGPYIARYAGQLVAEGYARQSARLQIRLVADFSRWLDEQGISAHEVVAEHTTNYLRSGSRGGYQAGRGDKAALARLLNLLCKQGVIVEQSPRRPTTPIEHLVEDYDVYLEKERALSLATRVNYRAFVRRFLTVRFGTGPVELSSLCAPEITGFVRSEAPRLNGKRVQLMITALRSFLRFARYRGQISLDLAACVPSVASWSISALPRSLPPLQVEEVLTHCNRHTPCGRRDYAILLLLARLGLRAGEIAALTLEDIDWEKGCIAVEGKGGRVCQLPLPADVGEAIVAYLKNGRPQVVSERRVFLRSRAPVVGFKSQQAVCSIVQHALARAAIDAPRKGAHQFRHTLATEMLKRGASLSEIGELLRHQNPQTTTIYAKVDLVSLRTLALPWPGGVR